MKGWHGDSPGHSLAARGIKIKAEAKKKKTPSTPDELVALDQPRVNRIRSSLKNEFGSSWQTMTYLGSKIKGINKQHKIIVTLKETTKLNKLSTTLFAKKENPAQLAAFKAEKQGTANRMAGVLGIGPNARKLGSGVNYNCSQQVSATIYNEFELVIVEPLTTSEAEELSTKFGVSLR